MWSLEPEGEAEKQGAIGPGREVKSISVNPKGESCPGHARAKMARKEKENQATSETEANQKARQEEGAEVQSPKRKIIRVESDETQDHVRDSLNFGWDEAEAISFVPSALTIARGPVFWCDDRCSDEALRFWQFA